MTKTSDGAVRCLIGVDGGGTKTAYALLAADGKIRANWIGGTTSYQALGSAEKSAFTLREGIERVLAEAGCGDFEIGGVVAGVSAYGENAAMDRALEHAVQTVLPNVPFTLVNDVEVGYYGALGDRAGVHLIAGTGSIAFGRDEEGNTARCGGWTSPYFSDEGSCFWLGLACMNLFTKQADGRAEKGALYEQMRLEFAAESDFGVSAILERDYATNRKNTAQLQRILLRAANLGDAGAIHLYEQAAKELALLASAVRNRLRFAEAPVPVSISGGVLHAGALIWEPLAALLRADGMTLCEAKAEPVEGALALCVKQYQAD